MFFLEFEHLFGNLTFFRELIIHVLSLATPVIFEAVIGERVDRILPYPRGVILVADDILQSYFTRENVKICVMFKFPPWLRCLLIYPIVTILWVAQVFDFYFARSFKS